MQLAPSEKRKSPREHRSGALSWRYLGREKAEVGWLLESSADGLAFAWRGEYPPKIGSLVELLEDTAGGTGQADRAVVRRTSNCHDDLSVIALEILKSRPFPPRLDGAEVGRDGLLQHCGTLCSFAVA